MGIRRRPDTVMRKKMWSRRRPHTVMRKKGKRSQATACESAYSLMLMNSSVWKSSWTPSFKYLPNCSSYSLRLMNCSSWETFPSRKRCEALLNQGSVNHTVMRNKRKCECECECDCESNKCEKRLHRVFFTMNFTMNFCGWNLKLSGTKGVKRGWDYKSGRVMSELRLKLAAALAASSQ